MGPRVLPAAWPWPSGQPHPTRQRAAQGLGLGSQGCCDQVSRVSRHLTAFAHSSGGKEPQAKVSSGPVPPEALKDLAVVPPRAPGGSGHPRPSPARTCSPALCPRLHPAFRAPSGSASAPLLMVTEGHCSRDPPHANAVTSAKAPLRRRPRSEALAGAALGGTLCQPARTRAPGWGEPGRGCLGGSPLQPRTLGALVAVTVTAAGPPSLPAPGRRRVLPPRLPAALPPAEPPPPPPPVPRLRFDLPCELRKLLWICLVNASMRGVPDS